MSSDGLKNVKYSSEGRFPAVYCCRFVVFTILASSHFSWREYLLNLPDTAAKEIHQN